VARLRPWLVRPLVMATVSGLSVGSSFTLRLSRSS
jgi:hypothetical protein